MQKKVFSKLFFYVIICSIVSFVMRPFVTEASMPVNKRVIVIDAGHGEWDPGKKSDGVEEKDINLRIAEKLQTLLEMSGAVVFVTRADDTALAGRKREDLKARAGLANDTGADIFISIHQNSYGSPSIRGAQAFYLDGSDKSKALAEKIQSQIIKFLNSNNRREAKANDGYYVLKSARMPAVIVECGFLSNPDEAGLLLREDYQDRVAWAVYMGISDYFEEYGKNSAAEIKENK